MNARVVLFVLCCVFVAAVIADPTKVCITGIDRVVLLKALWEKMEPARFFVMNSLPPPAFDAEAAKEAVTHYIDYFCGRCIKTDLSGDEVDPWGYDYCSCLGVFADVVVGLRQKQCMENSKINK